MLLDEMQKSVCRRLPHLLVASEISGALEFYWHDRSEERTMLRAVDWTTDGHTICHEALRMVDDDDELLGYWEHLFALTGSAAAGKWMQIVRAGLATWEQKVEALCSLYVRQGMEGRDA